MWKAGRNTDITGGLCNGVDAWIPAHFQFIQVNESKVVITMRKDGKVAVDEETIGHIKYDEVQALSGFRLGILHSIDCAVING